MKTLQFIFATIATIILILNPHLLVIAIWYPIGLFVYGVYKGLKGETIESIKSKKGVQ